jgi:multicomponent Na+:H+ antiporter subunit E
MRTLIYNIFLTFIWVTLTMNLSVENVIIGFVVSYLALWFVQRKNKARKYFYVVPRFISFSALFIKEVVVGSMKICYDIITPKHFMNPGIIAVPLDVKTDLEITILANAITLTPGTTSLAVSDDKSVLYVYNVYLDKHDIQKSIDAIKNGLEKKLLEVIR